MKKTLLEGGNVFKDAEKNPLTDRINKENIKPSLKFVEKILGIKLDGYLGTTGKKDSSGDIDIAVDEQKYDKKEIANILKAWAKAEGLKPGEWVKLSGTNVHFKTPIRNAKGKHVGGYAQLDLMFGNPAFQKWSMRGEAAPYKGVHRHIVMANIAKAQGLKWSYLNGVTNRDAAKGAGELNPKKIVKILLPGWTGSVDTFTLENILKFVYKHHAKDPAAIEAMTGEARATLSQHYGVELPEPVTEESDQYFLARLRDKIISTGSEALMEKTTLTEAAGRISHLEDLVLDEGPNGLIKAIKILRAFANGSANDNTSLKWDGSPAVYFGRLDDGKFFLTDKSGYVAKGYDGKSTSPKALGQMFANRKAPMDDGRKAFVSSMMGIFKIYEKLVPKDFRGALMGDLMYYNTPSLRKGSYVFKPNVVEYSVRQDSNLGQAIGKSKSAVVVHAYTGDQFSSTEDAISNLSTNSPALVIPPVYVQHKSKINTKPIDKIESYVKKNLPAIKALFNPAGLKGISNIHSGLIYKYINNSVKRTGGLENLGDDFVDWLNSEKLTDKKRANISAYLTANKKGITALWTVIKGIMKLKDFLVTEFDSNSPDVQQSINGESGGEGYVVKSPSDGQLVKLVPRGKFSAANFAAH